MSTICNHHIVIALSLHQYYIKHIFMIMNHNCKGKTSCIFFFYEINKKEGIERKKRNIKISSNILFFMLTFFVMLYIWILFLAILLLFFHLHIRCIRINYTCWYFSLSSFFLYFFVQIYWTVYSVLAAAFCFFFPSYFALCVLYVHFIWWILKMG